MKNISKEELAVILEKHKLWLIDDPKGVRANLSGAYLRRADLSGADLREADLREADLKGADLSEANLKGVNLREADLSGSTLRRANLINAYLWRADLSGANLREVNLIGADLSGVNLTGADLREANLRGVYLRGANLRGANLLRANLSGADLRGTGLNCPIACPEKGSFIGFKKCNDSVDYLPVIVELEILADAARCSATSRKCRCSKAKVLSITKLDGSEANGITKAVSNYDSSFVYKVGKIVEVKNFDPNRWNECAPGIHFFITRQEAVDY